ncbi:unnamed protein product, partial [Amoebophrya sp. A120]
NIARAADAATTQPPTTFQPFNATAATITSEQDHTEGGPRAGEQILQQEEHQPQQDTASFGSLSPVHQNEESTHYLQEGNSAQEFLITPRGVAPAGGAQQQTSGGYLGRPPVAPTSGAGLNPAMNQAMIVQPETPPGEVDAGVEDETEAQEDNVAVLEIGQPSTQQGAVPTVVANISGGLVVATPPARPGTIQFGVASDPATKKRRVLGSSKAVVLDIVVDDSTTKPFAEIDAKAPTTSAGKVQLQQHTEDFTSTSADEQSHRDPGPAGSSSSPEEVQLLVTTKNKKQDDGEAAPTAPKTPTGERTTEENNKKSKSISPLQRIPANTSSPSHTTRGLAKTING